MYRTLLLAFVACVAAFTITEPGNGVSWTSGASTNTIKWTSEASDPSSFDIRLVASESKNLQGALAIAASVNASAGELAGVDLNANAASGYKIVFTSLGSDTDILATSQSFAIHSGTNSSTTSNSTAAVTPTSVESTAPTLLPTSTPSTNATSTSSVVLPTSTMQGAAAHVRGSVGSIVLLALAISIAL